MILKDGRILFDDYGTISIDMKDSIKIRHNINNEPYCVQNSELEDNAISFRLETGELHAVVQPILYNDIPNTSDVSDICDKIKVQKLVFNYIPKKPCDIKLFSVVFDFLHSQENLWESARNSFHWIPNIKSKPNHVAGQHVFRSPAAIVTAEDFGAALIPDLTAITSKPEWDRFLDLRFHNVEDSNKFKQAMPPKMEYGIQSIVPSGHVYYEPDNKGYQIDKTGIFLSFYMIIFNKCSNAEILRFVTAFQWEKFAKNYESTLLPQTAPFAKYAVYGNSMALQYLWEQGPYQSTGGIALTTFKRADGVVRGREYPDDIWFHAWFNNMRTAMELAEFGQKMGKPDWVNKAFEIAKCLVSAPQKDGVFPTIFAPHDGGWIGSSEHGGGKHLYSIPDCAWSSIWLRKFIKEYGSIAGAESFLSNFRGFLCKYQNETGGFPCWVSVDSLENDKRLNDSAAGALAVWFLGEELLSDSVSAEEYERVENAVISGAEYIISYIIPNQRFEDFELYYSCSGKPLDFFDEITSMYGQNTLAIQWCAESLRVAHILTGSNKYLDAGLFCLNLLSLYQQIWDAPFLDFYSFGGFGVMNTDGEWNDARQAQFSETYMNYYELTRNFEFIRRAVAAVRSSFALMVIDENKMVCPNNYRGGAFEIHGGSAENYGHTGRNARSGQSGFHWGTGSALVTAARIKKRYGDLLIDIDCRKAIGIDGIVVKKVEFYDDLIDMEIETLSTVDLFDIKINPNKTEGLRNNIIIAVKGFNIIADNNDISYFHAERISS